MEAGEAFRAEAAAAGVRVRPHPTAPRIQLCSLDSAALGRQAECIVVLPRGWSPARTYPAVYLLHGSDDTPYCWLDKTDLLELAADAAAVLVLPEGGVVGYYTNWRYPAADGTRPAWERFHLEEIPQRVLAGCPTEKQYSVAGISMGGYGALAYATKYPDRFRTVVSLSGLPHITKHSITAFLKFTLRRQGERGYAPFGRKRDASSGWVKCDPYWKAAALRDARVYLAWGDGRKAGGDAVFPGSGLLERLVARSNRCFHRKLLALGVRHVSSVRTGTHDWPYWRRELRRAWRFLAEDFTSLD